MNVMALWPWLVWGWFAAECVLALTLRTWRSGGRVLDRGSLLLIWVAITVAIMSSDWVVSIAPWKIFGGALWLRPLSLAILVLGLTIRAVSIFTLRRWFSMNVAIRHDQRVHRTGLYRFVRHPSYLGMELGFLAIGLHSRNWAFLAIIVVLPTMAMLYRIHVEERALREAFGEEYADYSRMTKRLIPGVY
jgi:protein-S-isoprenylcysteine O-methyltransferase Ste14